MYYKDCLLICPEIILIIMALFLLIAGLYLQKSSKVLPFAVQSALLMACVMQCNNLSLANPTVIFSGSIIIDKLSTLLKIIIECAGIIVISYSSNYLKARKAPSAEYLVLMLFSMVGMMILVSAADFLSLYLGLELFALPLYAMIAMLKREKDYSEAAMKYFVLGALSSGIFLYGISLLYGATLSFDLATIATKLPELMKHQDSGMLVSIGMLLVLVGFLFKLGSFPFHMWIPDVYQGAPTAVTLFIGTLPKVAAFGMGIRILNDTFLSLQPQWEWLVMMLAIISLLLGNLGAIVQKNIKRMLGYSTIGHIGFILLGLFLGTPIGNQAALYYVTIYVLMTLATFGVLIKLSSVGLEAENIEDFKGLYKSHPWYALLMLLVMLSLAGIPPTVGFYAKLFILENLVNAGYLSLAVIALVTSVIATYYYLRIIRYMFFEESSSQILQISEEGMSGFGTVILSLNALLLLALGLYPKWLTPSIMAIF